MSHHPYIERPDWPNYVLASCQHKNTPLYMKIPSGVALTLALSSTRTKNVVYLEFSAGRSISTGTYPQLQVQDNLSLNMRNEHEP